ncbi:putative ABC transporter permease [Spiroplasma syrphidicola EA-1]|uniref:Putative ABC transporter permease n=1 Tax=Spiroplasma syrphidicola EA-1 TaxID=1276229 RepID=R4U657_9MOLU|nr:ABC transporter permease [Spiroplasma syrphidicola]AGM26088.1 putative ABC transporter permease [Spiroplasma syrphidicola EA-1]
MKTTPNKNINFKSNFSIFTELILLINKSFFREKRGPIFIFIVSTIFLVVFYYIFNNFQESGGGTKIKTLLLFIYMLLPALSIIVSLSTTLVDWKKSVFLKRIDATGVKKSTFLVLLALFYLFLGIIGFFFEMLFGVMIATNDFIAVFKNINWGYLMLALMLTILLSIAIAFLLGGIFSNEGITNSIAIIIYILTLLLSGVLIYPPTISFDFGVRVLTYFIPHKYPIFLFYYAITGTNWEAQFNTGIGVSLGERTEYYHHFTSTWQPIVASILLLAVFIGATKFLFKWNI